MRFYETDRVTGGFFCCTRADEFRLRTTTTTTTVFNGGAEHAGNVPLTHPDAHRHAVRLKADEEGEPAETLLLMIPGALSRPLILFLYLFFACLLVCSCLLVCDRRVAKPESCRLIGETFYLVAKRNEKRVSGRSRLSGRAQHERRTDSIR